MKAERAWEIPCKVYEELGNFDINYLAKLTENTYVDLFLSNKYHRFNEVEAKNFYKAIQRIKNQYDGDASNIWNGCPSSATVVYRFLEFEGMGIKIAPMAANILARQLNPEFPGLIDYSYLEIGRTYCHEKHPVCNKCPLKNECKKNF